MSPMMIGLIINATLQTLGMVLASCTIAVVLGLPLGVLLLVTRKNHILQGISINRFISIIVNIVRSVPFIILMVAITPLTQIIVGTSIGTVAAIVPLSISAIPFFARLCESALNEVPSGLIEAALAMGASPMQIIRQVLIAEAMPGIIRATTITLVALVGYSAMAGAIGGGGLGDLAIRYGYQRFELSVMFVTVAILVLVVQALQMGGDLIVKQISHRRGVELSGS
jgi:D-methionine transport system permease protein